MKTRKFRLHHLFLGAAGLLIVEGLLLNILPGQGIGEAVVLLAAIVGAIMTLYVSIEAIEEVRNRPHLLTFLSFIVLEFILFFSFQYGYLLVVQPGSYPTLGTDIVSLLLHSTMIFIFNPLYLPATGIARAILLVNTLGALFLVMFILQNIWQLRGREEKEKVRDSATT